jgi:hypothetical protein
MSGNFDNGVLFDTPNWEFAQSDQGRFLSPDPAGSGWNQYAYPANPNSASDPSGLNLAYPTFFRGQTQISSCSKMYPATLKIAS